MSIAQSLLPEFDMEMANTRKTLERVPEDKLSYTPHAKSMTMQALASHLVDIPGWAVPTLLQDSLDLAPPGAPKWEPTLYGSRTQMLETFDKNVAAAREALSKTTDQDFMRNWSLLMGGNVMFAMPKIAVMRSMIMNHAIHHRAQLAVYLRMNDVPVPALYGPSADEGQMGAGASA
ncbi:MAG: DinB family protein [Bryobacterales bacterium]|nr:DinB family protein [Bryobacterales bacterium]